MKKRYFSLLLIGSFLSISSGWSNNTASTLPYDSQMAPQPVKIKNLSGLLGKYFYVRQTPTEKGNVFQNDTVSFLYDKYISVLDSLNNPDTPERYIETDPNYYRLFVPATYYKSSIGQLSTIKKGDLAPGIVKAKDQKYLSINNSLFSAKERVNKIVDKALMNLYLNNPEAIIFTEDDLDKAGVFVDNIESEEILNLANGFGIKNGILKSSINASILENYILNEFPNISWASVNLTGSRLNLEVKEKTIPPELIPSNFPCNIISDSDAQIVRLEIYSGKPEVKVGDAVTKGQILVNGITEDSLGNSKCCQAEAKIFAKIKKTIKEEIYLEQINKIKKNKKIKRKNLTFFNVNIPLNFLPIPKGNYERKFKVKNLTLFNKKLPVTLYEEIWNKFEINRTFLAFPKAKELALENISRREKLELNDIKILNYEDNFKKFNNRIILNRFYTCIKDISKKEQITMR